ncbi:MAG: flippase [bacterium]
MAQSTTQRIAKNFSWLMIANIAGGLINFFMIIYIARLLGSSAFGLFQFSQAFLLYLVLIVDSGLSVYGTREIAKDRASINKIVSNVFALRLLIALTVLLISLSILFIIPIAPMIRTLFSVTFLLVIYRALNSDWVFQGLEKMEYLAVSKLIFSVAILVFIVMFVKGPSDLIKIPLIQLLWGLLVGGLFFLILYRKYIKFDIKEIVTNNWPRIALISLPLGVSGVLMLIYDNLDTIMLGIMTTSATVGIYNAAYRIFYIFAGIFSMWLATALPVMCKRLSQDQDRAKIFIEKFIRLTMLLLIPVSLLVCLASPIIISLFFGSGYVQAGLALSVLIWALVPLAISNTYGSLILIPAGRFKQFLISVGVGAMTNIALNFILIPQFSYIGAAIATILAQISAGITAYYYAQKIIKLNIFDYLFKPIVVLTLSFLVFTIIYWFTPGQQPIPQLIFSSLGYLTMTSWLIFWLEREFLFGFIKEILRK